MEKQLLTTSPKSWYDAIIYSLMIDRFNNGDPSNDNPINHDSLFKPANYNGGDLQGIINKINEGYFNLLGINTVWISPIVDNTNNAYMEYPPPHRYYTGYHGYWPVSFQGVEEHFGDMNLAKEFVNKSHQNDINVLLTLWQITFTKSIHCGKNIVTGLVFLNCQTEEKIFACGMNIV